MNKAAKATLTEFLNLFVVWVKYPVLFFGTVVLTMAVLIIFPGYERFLLVSSSLFLTLFSLSWLGAVKLRIRASSASLERGTLTALNRGAVNEVVNSTHVGASPAESKKPNDFQKVDENGELTRNFLAEEAELV